MSDAAFASYPTSQIKRNRATKHEMICRHADLLAIVDQMKPMTVRQVFYQATVRNIIEKSESGYNKVQTDLVQHAQVRRAAVRLARRQHPVAAQAEDLQQRSGRARRDCAGCIANPCGLSRRLCRDMAGEGRVSRRRDRRSPTTMTCR